LALARKEASWSTLELSAVGNAPLEEQLVAAIRAEKPSLVLLPWHLALGTVPHATRIPSRLEGEFGLNRLRGPLLAGYYAEPPRAADLRSVTPGGSRLVLIDLATPTPWQARTLLGMLALESKRTGSGPWLESRTKKAFFFHDRWFADSRPGERLDALLNALQAPETSPGDPGNSLGARLSGHELRLLHQTLWSIAFDALPNPARSPSPARQHRATLHFSFNEHCLVFRLGLAPYAPAATAVTRAQDFIRALWPGDSVLRADTAWARLVADFDLVRVLPIQETGQLELTAVLLRSAPSADAPRSSGRSATSLWIEPITRSVLSEDPLEPLPSSRPLLEIQTGSPGLGAILLPSADEKNAELDRLRRQLDEKTALIRELRAGGVGFARPIAPPDGESLLEAFQSRLDEAQAELELFGRAPETEKTEARDRLVSDLASWKLRLERLLLELDGLQRKHQAPRPPVAASEKGSG
jgi:hypothetical protein